MKFLIYNLVIFVLVVISMWIFKEYEITKSFIVFFGFCMILFGNLNE